MGKLPWIAFLGACLLICDGCLIRGGELEDQYFGIRVVDSLSKRGVPMVDLTTVSKSRYVTDSAGWVAFFEPGLMNREVFFEVSSHGYTYPKDGFGSRGKVLLTEPGKTVTIEVTRENVAQRLYRITGQGIYRDSWLLGKNSPIESPLLNGDVVGQDTVQTALYKNRVYWFWGDTNRPLYPLGQFKTSGAVSDLPSQGGLSPNVGINLNYFVDEVGFSRQMAPVPGPGAVWLHGVFRLKTDSGERLFGHYSRVKTLGEQYEHGLVQFNDETEVFEKLIELDKDEMLYPRGQVLEYKNGDDPHIYFCRPFPSVRIRATKASVASMNEYESFTCLQIGARFDQSNPAIERDREGRVVWGWKKNTDVIDARRMHALIDGGFVQKEEARLCLRSEDDMVYVDSGSVHWNSFRKRWVMIAGQVGGKRSFLGEIWYAEADSLEGPWINARLILSHDHYTFYNPAHHSFFDQEGGRVIFFEGTYSTTFSQAKMPTPRYDYNQIMYSLTLDDPRLNLPVQ
ncbi:hypothetical protein N8766_00920 [bacterium]|jgi:hypothetical protein|nr:hypothetical protein [Verrucomicrobiota bacterium]MDA7632645.1 hypothetical protein [bacterium]MDA7657775.1 hypothetical protein [Verrucomicrobiota bacterium]